MLPHSTIEFPHSTIGSVSGKQRFARVLVVRTPNIDHIACDPYEMRNLIDDPGSQLILKRQRDEWQRFVEADD